MRQEVSKPNRTVVVAALLALSALLGAGAFAADPGLVTKLGGSSQAVAVQGSYAYASVATKLVALDVSDPAHPLKAGETPDLPGTPMAIRLLGHYAYVPIGDAGVTIVDVLAPANPSVVSTFDTPGTASDVALHDVAGHTYAYVADGPSLRVFDVTDPSAPVAKGVFTPGSRMFDVVLAPGGTYAYATGPDAFTFTINVSNPDGPSEVSRRYTAYDPQDLAVDASNNRLYVLTANLGLETFDITNPAAPAYKSVLNMDGGRAVVASGSFAYVAVDSVINHLYGLKVVDVGTATSPHLEGTFPTRGGSVDIALLGQKVFLADQSTGTRIVDVTAPSAPSETGFYYASPAFAQDVTTSGHYAYVAAGGAGLRIFDVQVPSSPVEVGSFQTTGYLYAVAISGNYAYLAEDDAGLRILDVSDPAHPAQTGLLDTDGYVKDVKVVDRYAYLADNWQGVRIVDVFDKTNPSSVGLYGTNLLSVTRLAVYQGNGFLCAYANGYEDGYTNTKGMAVLNVGAPGSPSLVRTVSVWPSAFADVAVAGDRLYAAQVAAYGMGTNMLRIYGLGVADNPSLTGSCALTSDPAALWTDGASALLADSAGARVCDVSDPASPTVTGGYAAPSGGLGIVVASPYVFLADAGSGLFVLSSASCQITACSATVPGAGQAAQELTFLGAATTSSCPGAVTFDWDYGDGSAHGSGDNAIHAYAAPGTYLWTMTASTGGQICVKTGTVRVTGAVPLAVPFSSAPVRVAFGSGKSSVTVTWDAENCPSSNYHILCGTGDGLPSWVLQGGACGLGTSGSYTWATMPDPPATGKRFLWFVVVGDDGANTEGSWGKTSAGAERGAGPSGQCGFSARDTTGTCS